MFICCVDSTSMSVFVLRFVHTQCFYMSVFYIHLQFIIVNELIKANSKIILLVFFFPFYHGRTQHSTMSKERHDFDFIN